MLTNDYGRSRSASPKAKSHFTNQNTEQNDIDNNKSSDKKHRLPSDELITEEVKLKMELVQSLTEPCERATYSKRKKAVAEKLGVSIRSVERLLKKYRKQGLVGLTKTRSDKGQSRISEDWKKFIIETYKSGEINFECLTYKSEHLKGMIGELVSIRYDPDDITTILVYELLQDSTEQFLDYAHAPALEDRRLSLRAHKAYKKKLREAGEKINNRTILAMLDREEFIEDIVTKNRQLRKS